MSNALLLNEPEPATRSFLERHLTEDGFEVVGAENGEALELLERVDPDLVLIGDPDGPEVCRRLREGEPGRSWNREVPVILLGRQESDAVDRVRAFERGCDDYVVRPFVTTSSSLGFEPCCGEHRRRSGSVSSRARSRSTGRRGG